MLIGRLTANLTPRLTAIGLIKISWQTVNLYQDINNNPKSHST